MTYRSIVIADEELVDELLANPTVASVTPDGSVNANGIVRFVVSTRPLLGGPSRLLA